MAKSSSASQTPKKLPSNLAFYMLKEMPGELGLLKEPMYEFSSNNYRKVEYLCDVPFTSFAGVQKYVTVAEKAAALFYTATKDHLFPNGNKRTAVILTCSFLVYNNKWIRLSHEELYGLSLEIASSSSKEESKAYNDILKIFKERIVDIADAE